MAALTIQQLRATARLYRSGVDGAAEELQVILADQATELPLLLGFPAQNLSRLFAEANAVELLVATIEGAPRLARDATRQAQVAAARALVGEVSTTVHPDGAVELGVAALYRALSIWPGNGPLVLGERGSVELARLRALLRACSGVDALTVLVRREDLIVAYTTGRSRGVLRLLLYPMRVHAEALLVPLSPRHPVVIDMAPPTSAAVPVPRVKRPFAWHLVDAVAAALGDM